MTSVCQWRNGKCVYVSVSVSVCVIPLALFQVEFRVLVSPHHVIHVNQGGVQQPTPQVTLYDGHAGQTWELLHMLFLSMVIGSHVSYLILGKSCTRSGTQHHSFDIRLSFTTSTKYSWWVYVSKRFLLVHVVWDFSLTDFQPTFWVILAFLPASPSLTLPFSRFVGFADITTVSQSVFGVLFTSWIFF